MASLVVSIAGPADQVDLTVPAETPIEQLHAHVHLAGRARRGRRGQRRPPTASRARVSRRCRPSSTLAECGVVDGTVLYVQEIKPVEAPPEAGAQARPARGVRGRAGGRGARAPRRASRSSAPQAMLPDAPPFNERVRAGGRRRSSGRRRRRPSGLGAAPDDADSPAPVARPGRPDRGRAAQPDGARPRQLARDELPAPARRAGSPSRACAAARRSPSCRRRAAWARPPRRRCSARCSCRSATSASWPWTPTPTTARSARALTPDHRVFVDDLVDVLDHPNLSVVRARPQARPRLRRAAGGAGADRPGPHGAAQPGVLREDLRAAQDDGERPRARLRHRAAGAGRPGGDRGRRPDRAGVGRRAVDRQPRGRGERRCWCAAGRRCSW